MGAVRCRKLPLASPTERCCTKGHNEGLVLDNEGNRVNTRRPGPGRGGAGDSAAEQSDRNDAEELAAREARAAAIEAGHVERMHQAQRILSDANERDDRADARDVNADKRDMNANLHSWLHEDDESGAGYDARQSAAKDRAASKVDRASAAVDRFHLAEDDDPRLGNAEGSE